MLMKNKLSKMSLLGNWHTEDIDSGQLKFSVFSTGSWSKKYAHSQSSYSVYFSVERSGKSYVQDIRAKLQITWCFFAKQKYGRATDLSIVTYQKVSDYSYDFQSILIKKGEERKIRLCFN